MRTLEQIIRPFYTMTGVEREAMIQEITEHPDGPAYWALLASDCNYPIVPAMIHLDEGQEHDPENGLIPMCMKSALVRLKAFRDNEKLIDLQMREDNHER